MPETAPHESALHETHDALHDALDTVLEGVLLAVVERDAAVARARLASFLALLSAHADFEERDVLPLLAPLAPREGPGSAAHILPEHKLLARLGSELSEALASLPDRLTPRDVLDVLPLGLRVRGAYEHHTEREHRLYPLLRDHPAAAALAASLRALPQP